MTIHNPAQSRVSYKSSVKPGDTFVYVYTHSAEKLPVYEKFVVGDNLDIVLTETRLKSLAAFGNVAVPHEQAILKEKYICIKSKRHFNSITIRVAYYYRQQIILHGDKIELSRFAEAGNPLEIKIERMCRGENPWKRKIKETEMINP